jgi:hypothetical protein
MFMAATLREMARDKVVRVVELRPRYRDVTGDDGERISVADGVERVERVEVVHIDGRSIHVLAVGGSSSERTRDRRGPR